MNLRAINLEALAISLVGRHSTPYEADVARAIYALSTYFGETNLNTECVWESSLGSMPFPAPAEPEGLDEALAALEVLGAKPVIRRGRSTLNKAGRMRLINLASHADERGDDPAWRILSLGLGFLYFLAVLETGYGEVDDEESAAVSEAFGYKGYAPRELGGDRLSHDDLAPLAQSVWLRLLLPKYDAALK